jgi:hypothetical protein
MTVLVESHTPPDAAPVPESRKRRWVRLTLEIGDEGKAAGVAYRVRPLAVRPGQERAFLVRPLEPRKGVPEGGYRVVQYAAQRRDGRRHDCDCKASKFYRFESCRHVLALQALGLLEHFPGGDAAAVGL